MKQPDHLFESWMVGTERVCFDFEIYSRKGYISDALFYVLDWILTWVARKECRSKV